MNRDKLLKIFKDSGLCGHGCFRLADAILAAIKESEPLAVLAVRKEWPRIHTTMFRGNWYVSLWNYEQDQPSTKTPFSGDTIYEAEAKARAYLNGLPDREGR